MSPDIRIRRLNLKVVQHAAPWLSRDDLKRTGERVRGAIMADLDGLLERALAGCDGDERLGTIEMDLALGGGLADSVVPLGRSQVRTQLTAALNHAVAAALADQRRTGKYAEPPTAADRLAALPAPEDARSTPATRVLALLLVWHAEGCLAQRLDLCAPETIERWLEAAIAALDQLQTMPASRAVSGETESDGPSPRPTAGAAPSAVTPVGTAARLLALVALAARWSPFRPPAAQVRLLRGESRPTTRSGSDGIEPGAEHAPSDVAEAEPAQVGAPTVGLKRLPQRCAVQTALPFLMLGPLARVGWVATAGATLAGPDQAENAHALGYALALKALPIPARGWRHAPEHIVAAAFAAGLADPPHGTALARVQRALRDDLSALDATITDALLRGHDRRAPLALVGGPNGLALVEPDGLFPMALGAAWSDVAPAALAAGAPLLVDPSLPAAICAEIDAAGLTFVAPGTPTRAERWHPIAGPGSWRGMSNAPAERRAELIHAAVQHRDIAEDARGMLAALGPDRQLGPGLESGVLDRSVTLAAAMALGETCWRLAAADPIAWAEPEPCLAIQRFGDLPATMIVTRDEMEIRLPLGPRSHDLAAAGLLVDVDRVPWLERRLRFGVG